MKHLKTLSNEETKSAVSMMPPGKRLGGLNVFGGPHVIIDSQLESLGRALSTRMQDSVGLINFLTIVTSFVNMLKLYKQLGDLKSS